MQNRRSIERWCISQPATMKVAGQEGIFDCRIRDINFKGMQVSLVGKLPSDAFVKITLIIKGELIFDAEVWVVWYKSIGETNCYGLYFNRLKEHDREKIYRLIDQKCPACLRKSWWEGVSPYQKKGEEKMEDRRIFERLTMRMPLRFLDLNKGREGLGEISDISAKGIGFSSDEELRPATPIEVWVSVPNQLDPVYARGEVAWSQAGGQNEFRTGIRLEEANLMQLSRALRGRNT